MKIVIASGKGGTGKTTVAVNLAAAHSGELTFIDLDVEAPNSHIFLKPQIDKKEDHTVFIPRVDIEACDFCGRCARLCAFNALAVLPDNVLVFPELCHSCRGCQQICPRDAIHDDSRIIGSISRGNTGPITFFNGELKIGEALSPPLIKAVKETAQRSDTTLTIIDSPPGTSCPVIEAVKDADFVLLVTEPTPFGLNDLKLAVEMARKLGLPHGVAVNRSTIGTRDVWDYCAREDIPILLEIASRRDLAEAYSRGELLVEHFPEMKTLFQAALSRILSLVNKGKGRQR